MPVVIVVMRMFVMIMVVPVPVMVVVLVFLMAVVVMVLRLPGLMFRPHLRQQFICQRHLLHSGKDGLSVQLVPRGREDGGGGVLLLQHRHGGLQLLLGELLSAREDNGAGGLHLIIIELAKVLHIHLHLGSIRHGDKAVKPQLRHIRHGILHRHNYIRELANPGGFNENAVRMELSRHILQRLVEIPHQ